MNNKLFIPLLLGVLLLAACAPIGPGGLSATATLPPKQTNVVPTGTPLPTAVPTAVPTSTHIPVDLPPAQLAAIQAAAKKYNLPVNLIIVVSAEAVTWPSGCLGVVLPGVMCTQNQVQGFRIVLEAKGQRFEFHTNQDGQSVIDAAQQLATLNLVVNSSKGAIQLVNPNIRLGPTYNPAFNGFLPAGGATAGAAYVLDFTQQGKAVLVDGSGIHDLAFIKNPNYALALWRGGPGAQPVLAWGTQPGGTGGTTSLMIASLDGKNLQTLLAQDAGSTAPVQLVAEFWSADGQSLYYSKEPYGLGGYILFAGASNLDKIDVATRKISELIPQIPSNGPMACLDALSGDYRYVVDHCLQKSLTIRDLSGGKSTIILPPAEVKGFNFVRSARFSPDGSRVAYALAKGNPDDEQGWVAVSDGKGGSKLILTGATGMYYTVAGWLSDQTILVQANSLKCSPACSSELWTIGADGSQPAKIADGSFLTIIDNR